MYLFEYKNNGLTQGVSLICMKEFRLICMLKSKKAFTVAVRLIWDEQFIIFGLFKKKNVVQQTDLVLNLFLD